MRFFEFLFGFFNQKVFYRTFEWGNRIILFVFDEIDLTDDHIGAIVQLHHFVPNDANTLEE